MSSTLTQTVRDYVVRAGLAGPAMRAYGLITAANPRTVIANRRIRREGASDGLPIPPSNLIFLVAGTSRISWFLAGGARAADSITAALKAHGQDVGALGAMLDFGCGCGRVLRHWSHLTGVRVCGTDANSELVEWSRRNLPFAEVGVNQLAPPLAYADAEFDLVYALSVLTHLPERLQRLWIAELFRVLKPGGYFLLSAHGEAYLARLDDAERARFREGHLVIKGENSEAGSNAFAAYHPLTYVRDDLGSKFEVLSFLPRGAAGNPQQDLYVMRRPK